MKYRKRILDDLIEYYKSMAGCLYIKGPRWCGKTTTVSRHAKTIFRLNKKDTLIDFNLHYESNPDSIFSKKKPIFFDEWQLAPYLWDAIRDEIDLNDGEGGLFFITGSSELSGEEKDENILHSGTGRFLDLTMRPMSLYESGESEGSISLSSLFEEGANITGRDSSLTLDDLIFATCRGGWPRSLRETDKKKALLYPSLIVDRLLYGGEILEDSEDGDKIERIDPIIMERIMRSYARNTCTMATNSKILEGARGNDVISLDRKKYDAYKAKLVSRYLIEEVESWCPAFKSRSNVTTSNKKAFIDPSLAIYMLHLSPEKLSNDLIDYGFFFENLCIRDLRVYASKDMGRVCYYHDRNGKEVDAVVILRDGRYALVECKLGYRSALAAADGLLEIKNLIEKHNESLIDKSAYMNLPSSLIVLHAGKEALTLPSGVHIVPIGSLKD